MTKRAELRASDPGNLGKTNRLSDELDDWRKAQRRTFRWTTVKAPPSATIFASGSSPFTQSRPNFMRK
jgi:hypothetical protein